MIAATSLITARRPQVLRSLATTLTRPGRLVIQGIAASRSPGSTSRLFIMTENANMVPKREREDSAEALGGASSSKLPRLDAMDHTATGPAPTEISMDFESSAPAEDASTTADTPAGETPSSPKTKKDRFPDRRSRPKNKNPPKAFDEQGNPIKGRDRGRRMRPDEGPREPELDADGNPIPKAPKLPKRQCALMMGFCGSGYSGMQIQPDRTRTIEGVLFDALVKIGAVSQDNADNPTKVSLARAARTDAGVHAAGNVVSLKMILTIPGVKDIVARINEELPPEIRIWGYSRTQNSFNARLVCDSRQYTYFFPTYLLIPPKPGSGLHQTWQDHALKFPDTTSASTTSTSSAHSFWSSEGRDGYDPETSTKDEDLARKRAWRISPEQVETLRTLAKRYEGTHNFHNFTVGREFKDRSNNRYMKKIEISEPVVYGETEWISVLWHGQSFMLHQRKMMAILVLAARMGAPPRIISELYGQRDVFVPKMPSLGLLLEEPLFDSYNERMRIHNEKYKPTDFDYRPLIDWGMHREKMDEFKEVFIYKNMRQVEDRDGLFDAWMRTVDAYAGNDLLYLNPTGAVPEEAVIKQGERRQNRFREKKVFDTTSFPASGIKSKLEVEEVEEEGSDEEGKLDKRQLEETEG